MDKWLLEKIVNLNSVVCGELGKMYMNWKLFFCGIWKFIKVVFLLEKIGVVFCIN